MLAFILVLQLQARPLVVADIVAIEADANRTEITINAGTQEGLAKGSCGHIQNLPGSSFCLSKVNARVAHALVKLSAVDVKSSSLRVEVSP